MTKYKNKKMASLGLYMIFIGGLISISGGLIYNTYKDKSGTEKHKEILSRNNDLVSHIDSSTDKILSSIDTYKAKNEYFKTEEKDKQKPQKKSKNTNQMKQEKSNNTINNYAPNQGLQINENKGTVVFGKQDVIRTFSADDAKKILNSYPKDFPIEIWLKGQKKESMHIFEQVVDQVKALGYTNITTTIIGINSWEDHDSDFMFGLQNGKFIFSIYQQD